MVNVVMTRFLLSSEMTNAVLKDLKQLDGASAEEHGKHTSEWLDKVSEKIYRLEAKLQPMQHALGMVRGEIEHGGHGPERTLEIIAKLVRREAYENI